MNSNNVPRSVDGTPAKLVRGGLPLSGAEEPFSNFVYGSETFAKKRANCYSFAIDLFKTFGYKLQPGELSKTLKPTDDLTNAKTLKERTLADLKTKKDGGYVVSPCEKCKKGLQQLLKSFRKC